MIYREKVVAIEATGSSLWTAKLSMAIPFEMHNFASKLKWILDEKIDSPVIYNYCERFVCADLCNFWAYYRL